MDNIFEIASNVDAPLGLGGLFAVILFFTFRQILKKEIFPKLPKGDGAAIINKVIDKLFVLSIISMVLGFIAYILPLFFSVPKVPEKLSFTNQAPVIIGIYPNDLFGPLQEAGLKKGVEHFCNNENIEVIDLNNASFIDFKNNNVPEVIDKFKENLKNRNVLGISGPSITEITPAMIKENSLISSSLMFIASAAPADYLAWQDYRKKMPLYRISTGVDRRAQEISYFIDSAIKKGYKIHFLTEKGNNLRKSFGEIFLQQIQKHYDSFWKDKNNENIDIIKFGRGDFKTLANINKSIFEQPDILFYLGVGPDYRYIVNHVYSSDSRIELAKTPFFISWMHAHSIEKDFKNGEYRYSNVVEISDFNISAYGSYRPKAYEIFESNFNISPSRRDEAFSFDASLIICNAYKKLKNSILIPQGQYIKFNGIAINRLKTLIEKEVVEGVTGEIRFTRGENLNRNLTYLIYNILKGWVPITTEDLLSQFKSNIKKVNKNA